MTIKTPVFAETVKNQEISFSRLSGHPVKINNIICEEQWLNCYFLNALGMIRMYSYKFYLKYLFHRTQSGFCSI